MPAIYASDPNHSRGRLFDEGGSAHRSAFQRDRDRVIHSSGFRRLDHKTQVFVEHEGDYFRNRLTHSIEVGQVGRTISGALGLNLTWETLEGIAKHNGPVTGPLPVALADYNARHDLELHTHASAEAQVAAIADDIAYNNHDLDDGLRAGLFTVEDICALPIVGPCFAEVDARYPDLDPDRRRHEALRRVFGVMVEDVLNESKTRLNDSGAKSAQDIRDLGAPVIRFSDPLFKNLKAIRAFLFENMYRHWSVRRMRRKAAQIVTDIFEIFMADPGMLPPEWERAAQGDQAHKARVIADYLAGMTDRFAMQEHAKLTDMNLKS